MSTYENIGQSLNLAVERFISIGEIIAEENIDIKSDMYEATQDARQAGKVIERLCENSSVGCTEITPHIESVKDYGALILSSKSLLSSVTQILLLVDIIVVKKLLSARRRASESLEKLESVMNFTEFVRAFSVFGIEMTELAYLTGHHHDSFKEERRRAQMFSARQILERSISILLTSSKNSLVHSDCNLVKENRDTVFCQIRRAMDLIHFVVKDSIFGSIRHSIANYKFRRNPNYENESIYSTIKYIIFLIENYSLQSHTANIEGSNNTGSFYGLTADNDSWTRDNYFEEEKTTSIIPDDNISKNKFFAKQSTFLSSELRQDLVLAFEKLFEKAHDFTDSPYISHENRKNILLHCETCKLELNTFISKYKHNHHVRLQSSNLNSSEIGILTALEDLCKQLVLSVSSQMAEFNESLNMCSKLVETFHKLATAYNSDKLHLESNRFHDYCDHIFDLCKLLQHIAPTERLQVQAKCLAINLRIYGPQIFTASKILWKYKNSSAANENFEAFAEMWKWLTSEIRLIAKQIFVSIRPQQEAIGDNQLEQLEPLINAPKTYVNTDGEKDLLEQPVLDDKNSVNAYQSKWNEDSTDNNDILKRAKNMSGMAFVMYQFTKGTGTLTTTQDLFTQAEYFAEEANKLYKVLRHFSYQVPASENKKDLLGTLDRLPTFVQALQFTVKDHTVGQAATYVKVDHVIRETKNLMNVINKVVSKCLECANKYKLNFTGLSGGETSGSIRDDNVTGGMGESKGTTSSTEGSM